MKIKEIITKILNDYCVNDEGCFLISNLYENNIGGLDFEIFHKEIIEKNKINEFLYELNKIKDLNKLIFFNLPFLNLEIQKYLLKNNLATKINTKIELWEIDYNCFITDFYKKHFPLKDTIEETLNLLIEYNDIRDIICFILNLIKTYNHHICKFNISNLLNQYKEIKSFPLFFMINEDNKNKNDKLIKVLYSVFNFENTNLTIDFENLEWLYYMDALLNDNENFKMNKDDKEEVLNCLSYCIIKFSHSHYSYLNLKTIYLNNIDRIATYICKNLNNLYKINLKRECEHVIKNIISEKIEILSDDTEYTTLTKAIQKIIKSKQFPELFKLYSKQLIEINL